MDRRCLSTPWSQCQTRLQRKPTVFYLKGFAMRSRRPEKLLIPKDYMHENFNDVMYKLVGMEMDYLDSVPRKMWDEMVASS